MRYKYIRQIDCCELDKKGQMIDVMDQMSIILDKKGFFILDNFDSYLSNDIAFLMDGWQ